MHKYHLQLHQTPIFLYLCQIMTIREKLFYIVT